MEYDLQYPQEILADIRENRNWADYDKFFGAFVFDYNTYSEYCTRYELEQAFGDESKNYVVIAKSNGGWYTNLEVSDIAIEADTCTVKVNAEGYGITTGDICGYVLQIPCDTTVQKVVFIDNYHTDDKGGEG